MADEQDDKNVNSNAQSDSTPNEGDGDNSQKEGEKDNEPNSESYKVIQSKYHKMKRELEALKAQKDKEEQKRLEEEGKFKELSEAKQKRIEELEKEVNASKLNNEIIHIANELGSVDTDAVIALLDKSEIETEDGQVNKEQVKKAVENLKNSKPYLFGASGKKTIGVEGGSGTKPVAGKSNRIYKRSEIADSKFYKDNESDILLALREGRVQDDVQPYLANKRS